MTRSLTIADAQNEDSSSVDSELVPSSLAAIAPVLRVANAVQKENPRVAYLCRFHAFVTAHRMDQTSTGRGVRQFKTYMLHRLEMVKNFTILILHRFQKRKKIICKRLAKLEASTQKLSKLFAKKPFEKKLVAKRKRSLF